MNEVFWIKIDLVFIAVAVSFVGKTTKPIGALSARHHLPVPEPEIKLTKNATKMVTSVGKVDAVMQVVVSLLREISLINRLNNDIKMIIQCSFNIRLGVQSLQIQKKKTVSNSCHSQQM